MSDSLWRDEDYEPATLPSAAELLHPESVLSTPGGESVGGAPGLPVPPAMVGADGAPIEPELTRFLPHRRPGRFVIAALVTAAVFGAVALVVAGVTGVSGPKGVGLFFATIGTGLAGIITITWVWRWAGRRRSGIPTKRSRMIDVEGGRPVL